MRDNEPLDGAGLPDAGGLNIDYTDSIAFEPTEDQLREIRADLETIAEGVRPHLTDGFTVTTRVTRSPEGPQGLVVVAFPTGETIGPGIELTADMFEAADEPDWNGPISQDDIETLTRQITTITVARWAKMTGFAARDGPFPAH